MVDLAGQIEAASCSVSKTNGISPKRYFPFPHINSCSDRTRFVRQYSFLQSEIQDIQVADTCLLKFPLSTASNGTARFVYMLAVVELAVHHPLPHFGEVVREFLLSNIHQYRTRIPGYR